MPSNELYLVVLPLIHISSGVVEQTLTVLPNREFATEFFQNEVDGYMAMFKTRADQYLRGGHVISYDVDKVAAGEGRFVVKVIQNVG